MGKTKFVLNLPGLNELMKSDEMQAVLRDAASQVEAKANGMAADKEARYSSDIVVGYWIAASRIRAENGAALQENLENNTLVKALGSVGLKM